MRACVHNNCNSGFCILVMGYSSQEKGDLFLPNMMSFLPMNFAGNAWLNGIISWGKRCGNSLPPNTPTTHMLPVMCFVLAMHAFLCIHKYIHEFALSHTHTSTQTSPHFMLEMFWGTAAPLPFCAATVPQTTFHLLRGSFFSMPNEGEGTQDTS